MSASFYDLLKYTKTGIASPEMTAYDKMRAVAMAGGKVKTLTGVPPLSFRANGKPLISWSMLGNSQQNGTPTPDNPIYPDFCGERTANLFDYVAYFSSAFTMYSTYFDYADVQLAPNTTYTFSTNFIEGETLGHTQEKPFIVMNGDTPPTTAAGGLGNKTTRTLTTDSSGVVRVYKRIVTSTQAQTPTLPDFQNGNWVMCNVGSTALPYEPYGWKIPVTSAEQTQTVYLGQVQTARRVRKLVLTGEEDGWYLDRINSYNIANFALPNALDSLQAPGINWMCSHFIPQSTLISQTETEGILLNTAKVAFIRISSAKASTKDAFKAYLAAQYSAGTPVTIWYVLATPETAIVNGPLCKIGDYADELHSADAGVSIPTAKGQNTLTVDTELQPSSMTITYR